MGGQGAIVVPTALTVPLQCVIQQTKILAITNSTGATIPAGTRINWKVERIPDHSHQASSFVAGPVAPGTVMKRGIYHSFSCTAWFKRELVNAPAL